LRRIKYVLLTVLILSIHTTGGSAQNDLDLDYSITMPSIELIEGSLAVPAPLDLITQGIIKIFADTDGDDNITQEEADALYDGLSDNTKANLSLRREDLEPLIQTSVAIDNRIPRTLEVLDMEIAGLVGPVNSSTPLALIISFTAEFNVDDRIGHTVSFAVNESYAGDVDFSFTAPEGWEVDKVSGLTGYTIEDRNVYGTPVSQININLSEGISDDIVLICMSIGMIIVLVIVLIIFLVWRKSRSQKTQTSHYPQQPAGSPAQHQTPTQPPPQAAPPIQPPPQVPPPAKPQYQTPAPPPQATPVAQPQYLAQPPPPPPPAQNICRHCGSSMSFISQYQRYYCNYCRQYR
jgi:hypothetical protein